MKARKTMDRTQFIKMMDEAKLYDLTQGCSIFTPPWPGEKSLEVHFFKRVTGAYGGGAGANGPKFKWGKTLGHPPGWRDGVSFGEQSYCRHFSEGAVWTGRRRGHIGRCIRLQPVYSRDDHG